MDRKRLTSIETKLDLTLNRLEHFGSIDGPIGKLQQEIIINRQVAEAAHKRIDGHDAVIERIGGRQWQLWGKVAAFVGGGSAVFLAVKVVEAIIGK
jgi:hypothetical protein